MVSNATPFKVGSLRRKKDVWKWRLLFLYKCCKRRNIYNYIYVVFHRVDKDFPLSRPWSPDTNGATCRLDIVDLIPEQFFLSAMEEWGSPDHLTWPSSYPWGGAAAAGRCPSWTPPALCGHCSFSVPPFLAFNDSFSETDNSEISHQKRRSLTQKANTSLQVSNSPGRCI